MTSLECFFFQPTVQNSQTYTKKEKKRKIPHISIFNHQMFGIFPEWLTKTLNQLSKFLSDNCMVINKSMYYFFRYRFSDILWFPPSRNVSQHIPPAEGSSLLVCEETPSDSYLQQLLTYADSVANWISAEIVICDSVKVRGDMKVTGSAGEKRGSHYCHCLWFDFSSDTDSRVSHTYVLPVASLVSWLNGLGTRECGSKTWNSSL